MAIKNVEQLREFLSNELERVCSGDSTPALANAAANISGKIMSSVKMELEYNRLAGVTPSIGFLSRDTVKMIDKL